MNKAFVREPEFDGKAYCPKCGSLGIAVGAATLDHHIQTPHRSELADSAWFCPFPRCSVAYFDLFELTVSVQQLNGPVYPKHDDQPLCACFGFTHADLEADIDEGTPTRIRALLERSKSPDARCSMLAADGQCCMPVIQKLYMRLRG